MACGGKCHLMKQMAAAEQQDAEIPPLKSHFEVIFFVQPLTQLTPVLISALLPTDDFFINYLEGHPIDFCAVFFQPPRISFFY